MIYWSITNWRGDGYIYFPDEKGTESTLMVAGDRLGGRYIYFPDEKGTESLIDDVNACGVGSYIYFPDEKGTESIPLLIEINSPVVVTFTSPMKRGLKDTSATRPKTL